MPMFWHSEPPQANQPADPKDAVNAKNAIAKLWGYDSVSRGWKPWDQGSVCHVLAGKNGSFFRWFKIDHSLTTSCLTCCIFVAFVRVPLSTSKQEGFSMFFFSLEFAISSQPTRIRDENLGIGVETPRPVLVIFKISKGWNGCPCWDFSVPMFWHTEPQQANQPAKKAKTKLWG